jgi:serine/threonine-protein kinase RsbW
MTTEQVVGLARVAMASTASMSLAASAPSDAGESAFEVVFLPSERRVGQMRRITAAHMRHWDLTTLACDVKLVVTELVTNAVQHAGGGSVGLRVRRDANELRIEVTDGTPIPARPRDAGEADENGRGLLLVSAVSKEWGVSSDGTMTWCSLAIPEGGS